jgi:hypothetical protein
MGGGGIGSGSSGGYRPNDNGYYGTRSKPKDNYVRHLPGNVKDAENFYENITKGYIKEVDIGNGGKYRVMPDGSTITYRPVSSSDRTPAVDIKSSGGNIKPQKIHFIE